MLDTYNFGDELERLIPTDLLNESEKNKIEGFKAQLVTMFDQCEQKGGYTSEAADFQDRYVAKNQEGIDAKIKELLGAR